MDNRVSNNPVRVPTSNTVANAPRVPDQFTANATVNTSDAASFSSQATTGSGLDALTAAVSELETRIRQLESRVSEIAGSGAPLGGTAVLPPGMNLPAFPGARSNAATIPANNGAIANAPTNSGTIPSAPVNNFAAPAAPPAPVNNFAAPQPPANNFIAPPPPPLNNAVNASVAPINNVASNNAPANNLANNALLNYATANNAANNVAANNAPANNEAMLSATARVPAAPGSLESDLTNLRSSLSDLQGQVRTSLSELDRLLRVAPSPETAAKKEDAGKAKDGLDAVESVLRHVKPGSYTPEEEAVVKGAVQRVNQIGREIAKGKDPAEFAPELFSLKHVIIDPAGAGTHQAVTTGAQILAQINELQGAIVGDLQKLAKAESKGKLTTEQKAQKVDLTQRYNALTGIQTALDTAKLTRLTATGDKVAVDSVNRLGDLAEAIGSGDTSPVESQDEVFRLGQLLRNPNKAPDAGVLGQGADAVKQITAGQEGLHARLRELDAQVMAGQPAEAFAAERARLLASAEALGELGAFVTGAKLEQSSPAAKREIANGLAKSVEIAKALAEGESPAKYHTEIFVLKQTFQEPLASKENPAIQSVAATLQLIGRAETKSDKQRAEIAAKIAGGAAPRDFDAKSTALHRGAEDLETMRKALTSVDFGGLTPEQEAHGAKLADKMRDVTIKVASGEDFGKHRKTYEDLAAKLADLRNWKPAAPAPSPASPTPASPAGPEAGSMYAVKPGDFLTKIAREQLGDSNLWKDIVALNKDKYPSLASNPDMIHPGWMLVLPKGGAKPAASEPTPAAIPAKPAGTKPAPTPASNDPVAVGAGEPGADKPVQTTKPAPAPAKPTKPKPAPQVADAPKPAGGAKYTVKNGDYLAKIAKEQLGDATRFREIVELNKAKYPSLAKNPDMIKAGWVLTMPGGGKPTPTPPTEGPKPKPKPTPVPTPPVAPTPQPTSDKDAVSWLKANLGDDQRISRAEIEKMPEGPGKTATLEYFDALMFGYIDSGTEGWSNLFKGDVRKMEDALAGGQGIEALAKELSARILREHAVGDLNKDGTVDAKDLKLHADKLRGKPEPKPTPTPEAPKPTKPEAPVSDKLAQQRKDLDAYLNEPDNGNDSETTLHLLRTSPQYAEVATPAQKARLIKLALDGNANTQERAGALQVIEMAAARKELPALVEALNQQKALKDTLSDLGDNAAGQKLAKLFLENGLYKNETVWKAMDDDAAVGLLKAVGFSHPMIGTNDELRALPEAAKHHMIKQLVGGNVTWTELYMARWLNQHTEIPYRIPDFNNN